MKIMKEVQDLINEFTQTGRFTLSIGTGSHPIGLRHISGRRICLPSTPSDRRSIMNTKSMVRRIDSMYAMAH